MNEYEYEYSLHEYSQIPSTERVLSIREKIIVLLTLKIQYPSEFGADPTQAQSIAITSLK